MLLKDLNAYLWTALGIAWDQSNTHVDTSTKMTDMWYYFAWSQPSDICPDISYSHTVQVWLIYPHISSEIYPAAYFLKYCIFWQMFWRIFLHIFGQIFWYLPWRISCHIWVNDTFRRLLTVSFHLPSKSFYL